MNTHITLFDLLRLNEGQLSTAEAEILQESIGKNPELETKWALLQETYLQLIGPVTAKHWSRSNIHSLTIASYLDQQLSPTEEAEFEQTCWQENRVLFEVLDCYQSTLQPLSQEGLTESAKERMLGLLGNSLSSKQTSTTGEKPPGRTNGTPAKQNGFPRKAPQGENGKQLKMSIKWIFATPI